MSVSWKAKSHYPLPSLISFLFHFTFLTILGTTGRLGPRTTLHIALFSVQRFQPTPSFVSDRPDQWDSRQRRPTCFALLLINFFVKISSPLLNFIFSFVNTLSYSKDNLVTLRIGEMASVLDDIIKFPTAQRQKL